MIWDTAAIPALLNYDTAIDWPARLAIEGPFLRRTLDGAPNRRVVDLGASTGDHAQWLAAEGFTVVGIEGVKERWEVAQSRSNPSIQHLLGDLGAVEAMVRGHFGAAICLGNTLPALLGTEALSRMLIGLRRRLLPGGILIAQQVNYDRLYQRDLRELPDRCLRQGDRELVFRRALALRADGVVGVTETVFARQVGDESEGNLLRQRHLFQQGWRHQELCTLLEVAGFRRFEFFGGFAEEAYDIDTSAELVLVAI
jgi:glycine/sarcosine N-methyltransferase